MKKGGILPFALMLALLATSGSAAAADESKKLFAEGQTLIAEQKWDEAIEKFSASYELSPDPDVLLWKGYAFEQKESLLAAKETYIRALEAAREGKLKAEALRAEKALETIQAKIPRLRVRIPKDVSGAEIYLDATKHDLRSKSMEVNPGEHMIVVTAPSRQTFHVQLIVRAGDDLEIEAVMPSKIVPSRDNKKKAPKEKQVVVERETRALPIAVTVLGGSLMVGGIGTLVYGATDNDLQVAAVGATMTAVSGAFTVLGASWLTLSVLDRRDEPKKSEEPAPKWATIAPLPGGVWASVGGSF